MKPFANLEELFTANDAETLVLTPNRRLSRFLQDQFAQRNQREPAERCLAWPAFGCQSISGWYQALWVEYLLVAGQRTIKVMSAAEETALWLTILKNSSSEALLFNPSVTAAACRNAWNSMVRWQVSDVNVALDDPFSSWLSDYQKYCQDKSLTDLPQMVDLIIEAFSRGQLKWPKRLIFYAFDDIDPQLSRLLALAEQAGVEVKHHRYAAVQSRASRVPLPSFDDEIKAAALWAREIVAKDPNSSIGVVIPQLTAQRAKVERIFLDVFEPQYKLPDKLRHATPFNVSAGLSFKQTAPIDACLQVLQLNKRQLSIESIEAILRSPFIGVTDELDSRACLAAKLIETHRVMSIAGLRAEVGDFKSKEEGTTCEKRETGQATWLPDLWQRLQNLQELTHSLPRRQSPSEWGEFFVRQLKILGWPGDRPLDTLEFQQVERWRDELESFGHYDYIFSQISLNEALALIEHLARHALFQAQTKSSPVQVLGMLEAAGMLFDHLWVMGLDDESWPPSPEPNALLPLGLQKSHNMPRASAERELALAKMLTERFKKSAQHVVVSHSIFDGDKVLRPSPLIENILAVSTSELGIEIEDFQDVESNNKNLELLSDASSSTVSPNENIRGGTQVIKDQAACPFRAFVRHRLKAKKIEPAKPGLDPAERGMLIHSTLEYTWQKLKNQQALLDLSEQALAECVRTCAEQAFNNLETVRHIGEVFRALEIERVQQLVLRWLELEKERAPFSVLFNEKSTQLQLANLNIRIRYDRIDRLEDGRVFVIDYKTGKTSIGDWSGSRPNEPQVPLYALANQSNVAAVALGQINIDQVVFNGISEQEHIAPGITTASSHGVKELPEGWQEILTHWRQVLETLADDFIQGNAEVAPKSIATSCRYCDLHSVCRVHENLEESVLTLNSDEISA